LLYQLTDFLSDKITIDFERRVAMKKNKILISLLILDFSSIETWSHETILDLQKKYKIIHTTDGAQNGFEKYCFAKNDTRRRFFALVEDNDSIAFKKELEKDLKAKSKPHVILPSEGESKKLWGFLKDSQKEYRSFLDNCSNGIVDLDFINRILKGAILNFHPTN